MPDWIVSLAPLGVYLFAAAAAATLALVRGRTIWRALAYGLGISLGSLLLFIILPFSVLLGLARLGAPPEALILLGLPLALGLQLWLPITAFRLYERFASRRVRPLRLPRRQAFEIIDYQTGRLVQVDDQGRAL